MFANHYPVIPDVLRKVFGDLQGKGVDISEHLVRREMDELMAVARKDLES